ncbi:MAG: hypothetical protein HC869_08660 [Rhodospirillales bacterium]|nr:hypothetical protein [Rhodospirillales bacterium]
MAIPLQNGGPFVYPDTTAYLKHAAKFAEQLLSVEHSFEIVPARAAHRPDLESPGSYNVVMSGRSLYYGLFAYAGWMTSFWAAIAIQAGVLSWLVLLLFKSLSPPAWPYKAIGTLVVISLFSSASFFAGLLMPDIWAGIMILALALHWTCGHQLSISSKLAILAILAFSVLAHGSHFLLLAAVAAVFAVLWLLRPDRTEPWLRKMAMPTAALAIGVVGTVAWGLAVTVGYGATLLHRPFLTAHLTDMGPGTTYLQESCPESGFALCDYKDRLPMNWSDFLFDSSPETGVFGAAPVEVQLAIADEQTAFVLQTLAAEPVSTVSGLIKDGLSQLWTLSMAKVAITKEREDYVLQNAPPDLVAWLKETEAYNAPELTRSIERHNEILVALSALVLAAWLILRFRPGSLADPQTAAMDKLVTILITGIVLNALICGILASPFGRFQARIIWLLPLIASLVLVSQPIVLKTPRWLLKVGSR